MKRIAFYLSLVLVVLVLASCKKGQKNLFTPCLLYTSPSPRD